MATAKITAPKVKGMVDDHLTRHIDVYDILLNRHEKTLYGPDGGDGITAEVREIIKGYDGMKKIGVAIIITVAADIITRLMNFVP